MAQIPTAKQVYYKVTGCILEDHHFPNIEEAMIEYAKMHVASALKVKVDAMYKKESEDSSYSIDELDACTENSYPLDNIK
jgi:hypothetical protein